MRKNEAINYTAAQSLWYALDMAKIHFNEFNLFITVNLSEMGLHHEEAGEFFKKKIRNNLQKWCKRKGFELPYAWVLENVKNDVPVQNLDDEQNIHAHWCVYVPDEHVELFLRHLEKRIETKALLAERPSIIKVVETYSRGHRKYMLKGANDNIASGFGVEPEPQGTIIGQRSGVSRNIGSSVRKKTDKKLGINRRRNQQFAKAANSR